ncbi:flagellar protein FlaG [Gilvimarinus japonicus]|jgi:flagellar protein FlaG|uniref:Flagellar protein FlaG n=1 Tax=Gilvimarinus japonicus TaxID=1796469 RepID=A0ABV7HRB1_9GAMM
MNEVNATGSEVYTSAKSGAASSVNRQGGQVSGNKLPPLADEQPNSVSVENTAERTATKPEFRDNVRQAVAKMNEYVQSTQRDLQFSYNEELGETIVKVLDSKTQEVIRQIPDEVFVSLAQKLNADEPVPLLQAQA